MKIEGLTEYFEYRDHKGRDAVVFHTPDFDNLPEETKMFLEPKLAKAAALAFHRPLTESFKADVGNHIRGGDLFIAANGQVDGFALLQLFPKLNTLYISGIVKNSTAPSRVIEAVINRFTQEIDPDVLTIRTQSDRACEIVASHCPKVVAMDQTATNSEADLLSEMGLLTSTVSLNLPNLIAEGHFGAPMIADGERKRSKNPRVRSLTDRLDYYRGDALLLVGYRR